MSGIRDSEEIAGIRQAVRALCAGFPGEYWRNLDRDRAYPTEFVNALTEAGFLAALIPEEYGGSGLTMSSAIAKAAGYPRPILHGLATFGVAGHAILKTMCGYDPARFKSIAGRFSAPVYPGETIRTEMWRDGPVVSFRARLAERDVIVLNNGRVEIGN